MDAITNKHITIEHRCLQMRYAHLRIHDPKAIAKLMTSIEQYGQLAPVMAVPETTHQWVLIDGYHRVKALERLGKDTVETEVWNCNAEEALLTMLKNRSTRATGIFEEALLLHELYSQHNLSQHDLANRIGRDQSWISRRLSLVDHLPHSVLKALSEGSISLWVSERVLAPMARAIPDHAQRLLEHLLKRVYSTREVQFFYEHYQKANHQTRTKMLEEPELFFKAQKLLTMENQAATLRKGPEGKWQLQCKVLITALLELKELASDVFYRQTPQACFQFLAEWKEVTDKSNELTQIIGRLTDANQRPTPNNL
jgi:ParB family transcriptional regulator, chromosome partitioning protein